MNEPFDVEKYLPKDDCELFCVHQFFPDGTSECVRQFVEAEEAVNAACHYVNCVAARVGLVRRVIITDGGDEINFEWRFGKGVTFPPLAAK